MATSWACEPCVTEVMAAPAARVVPGLDADRARHSVCVQHGATMWKTLLVPHDFSECADPAMALAADLARLLLGSVTESSVRRSPVPVIIVRATDGAPQPTAEEVAAEDELTG